MTEKQKTGPYRVGLTGGIASGKTTVSEMFAERGVPIIDTDLIAREVVQKGGPALQEIRQRFGDFVIDAAGNLDRVRMRKLVFEDSGARRDLESILHPRIGAETRRQADAAPGPYQVIVVPLLVGSPLIRFVDRILVVDCDEETQIKRLVARDTESVEQARRIIAAQAGRKARLAIADDIIYNEPDLADIRDQVTELDATYRRLADHSCPREQPPGTP